MHNPYNFSSAIGIELKKENFPKLPEIVEKALKDDNLSKERKLAKSVAWQNIDESGKKTVDFLLKKIENIEKKGEISKE